MWVHVLRRCGVGFVTACVKTDLVAVDPSYWVTLAQIANLMIAVDRWDFIQAATQNLSHLRLTLANVAVIAKLAFLQSCFYPSADAVYAPYQINALI